MADEINVEAQQGQNAENSQSSDLSMYYKDDTPGVFDEVKINKLALDLQNAERSKQYFQSLYYKKNEVPVDPSGYANRFKADSMYERAMDQAKDRIDALRKWGVEEKIGVRELNAFTDYLMKDAVKDNSYDLRTEEEIERQQAEINAKEMAKLTPMLESLNRSKGDNDALLDSFFKAPSVFTSDPKLRDFLMNTANESGEGYQLATLIMETLENSGIPVVTGTIETQDYNALMQSIKDPSLSADEIQAKLDAFYKVK